MMRPNIDPKRAALLNELARVAVDADALAYRLRAGGTATPAQAGVVHAAARSLARAARDIGMEEGPGIKALRIFFSAPDGTDSEGGEID